VFNNSKIEIQIVVCLPLLAGCIEREKQLMIRTDKIACLRYSHRDPVYGHCPTRTICSDRRFSSTFLSPRPPDVIRKRRVKADDSIAQCKTWKTINDNSPSWGCCCSRNTDIVGHYPFRFKSEFRFMPALC
jgi:hypothetical protein